MNCPECSCTNIEKEWLDRYSIPGEVDQFNCHCNNCGCEFFVEERTEYSITEHGDCYEGDD